MSSREYIILFIYLLDRSQHTKTTVLLFYRIIYDDDDDLRREANPTTIRHLGPIVVDVCRAGGAGVCTYIRN